MSNSIRLSTTEACIILNALKGVGPITSTRLLKAFNQSPQAILKATLPQLIQVEGISKAAIDSILNWSTYFDLQRELRQMAEMQVSFIHCLDPDYPVFLKNISDFPIGLYCMGPYRPHTNCIAIIGSRRTSLYGLKVAKMFASNLAQRGFCIVSGMARGIDSAAHEGALAVGGKTIAVLGSGLDIIYPPENKSLYNQIAQEGLVVSEFPLRKNIDKQTFPIRNRIISGISLAVIVVETDLKGGSMITARLAGEQGRQVFVIPGRIDQPHSTGCHQLIREGATLLTSPDELIEELQYARQLTFDMKVAPDSELQSLSEAAAPKDLSDIEAVLLKTVRQAGPSSLDQLSALTSLSVETVGAFCLSLEIKKLISKKIDGLFESL